MLANLQQNLTQHLSSAFASGTTSTEAENKVLHKQASDAEVDTDLIGKEALKALSNANGLKNDDSQDAMADLLSDLNKR